MVMTFIVVTDVSCKFSLLVNVNMVTLLRIKFLYQVLNTLLKMIQRHKKISFLKKNKKIPTEFVELDHFLKINCDYLKLNKFNDSILEIDSGLSVFHTNVRSLPKHFDDLDDVFGNCKTLPDILTLSDTMILGRSIPEIDGYIFEYVDSPTQAGGVGAYLSNHLKYSLRSDLSLNVEHCEDMWIDLDVNSVNSKHNKHFIVGVIYRHPNHNYETFCEKLCETIDNLNKAKVDYYITGDFNIDIMKYKLASDVTSYVNNLNSVGCNICIDKPTRVDGSAATCIDHVYSNLSPERLDSHILISDVSDHYSLLTKIHGVSSVKDNTDIFFRKSNLSDCEWERFNTELSDILNHELPDECVADNIEEYANSITNAYSSLIDKFMPLKKLSRKQKQRKEKPWFTTGFRKSRDTKYELLLLSKSSKDPYHYANYKKYLNLYTKLKDIARINYYTHLAELYGNKSKTSNQTCE